LAERGTALVRARELAEQLGDETRLSTVLNGLSNFMHNSGAPATREFAEQALALAKRGGKAVSLAAAHCDFGQTLFWFGEFSASREHHERVLELSGPGPYRSFLEAEGARWSATYLVLIPILLGYPDTARKRSDDMLAAARRSADPVDIVQALFTDAWVNFLLGDAPKVQQRIEEELTYSAIGPRFHLEFVSLFRAWALAVQGQGITDPPRLGLALQLHFVRTSESIGHYESGGHGWLGHRLRRHWSCGRRRWGR
jgi:hypothetical protein